MKVVIDATSLLLRSAGVKNYLYYWLSSLVEASQASGEEVKTYPPAIRIPPVLDHERPAASAGGTVLGLGLVHACNLPGSPLLRLLLAGADVFHISQHMTSFPRRRNVTATIFDLSCWTAPEDHTPANIHATRRYGEKILKHCDGLIAISKHSRDDAIEVLGIAAERITVIYPGIADAYFDVAAAQVAEVVSRYQLRRPYLLFVGCIEPRKNVPVLVQAYRQLPDSIRKEVALVVAGPFGWASEEVRKLLTDPVRYLGYVPEPDLPGLIAGAAALVYPSSYEGFGLPVAQAMAAGVPVIASDRTSMPEVVGEAGLLVNPKSVEQLSDAMGRIVCDAELARELGDRAKVRAQTFRWPVCAEQSFEFFHRIAGR